METKRSIEATCPDCRGPLSECFTDGLREYSCLVGHRFSAKGVLRAHSEVQEKALWAAVVALEEATNLVDAVSDQFPAGVTAILRQQAAAKLEQAKALKLVLEQLEPFETDGSTSAI